MNREVTHTGRTIAYVGGLLGIVASIAANVAHSYVVPPGEPDTWTPPAGSVVSAIFWPLALLLAIEIMVRVEWLDDWYWQLIRWGGLSIVALVAAIVSYRHMSALLDSYPNEEWITTLIGPLAVDGLMVLSAGALLATRPRKSAQSLQEITSEQTLADVPGEPDKDASEAQESGKTQERTERKTERKTSPGKGPRVARIRRADPTVGDQVLAALADGSAALPDLALRLGKSRQSIDYALRKSDACRGKVELVGSKWQLIATSDEATG